MCKLQRKYAAATKARSGFSLVELLIVTAIFAFVFVSFFYLLSVAQSNFFNIDANIDIRNNLRMASEKIALELRNSGYQGAAAQFSLISGGSPTTPDTIRFSVPILCPSTETTLTTLSPLLNTNGVPANWGAPLVWGCTSYTCLNNVSNCTTSNYTYIQYSINASSQLQRQVLNNGLAVVAGSTTIIANDIVNLKTSLTSNVITFTLTGRQLSMVGRTLAATYTNQVLLNNING